MLVFICIVLFCFITACTLFNNFFTVITNWKMSSLPKWLAQTIRIILYVIVSVFVLAGVISTGIVLLAFSSANSNSK